MGRSMGSGPATHLCATRNPGNLILISPYTSIKGVADRLFGKFLAGVFMVKERFKNIEKIKEVKCPVLLIHGKLDKLISYEASKKLAQNCKGKVSLRIQEKMTHNRFNTYIEIINPIFEFWKENKFLENEEKRFINVEAIQNFGLVIKQFLKMKKKKEEVEGNSECEQVSGGEEKGKIGNV